MSIVKHLNPNENRKRKWIQKQSIDFGQEKEVDVNDNLELELSFYIQAKEGTRQIFEILQLMRLPFLRLPDYHAEMVKTDANMEKEKIKLLEEKKKIEAEERRKDREIKKQYRTTHSECGTP
uniref:Uncharacterized protein n=1 Tax=Nelumbo nucifera TaxID=4432 RepID=A0A822YQ55_NELNU|nr:TPA_asm: hypothetical protein HUJ06_012592 [Nelumbo nucifera]